jgi:glycosyltransferase involved in cell wall biosynthesis
MNKSEIPLISVVLCTYNGERYLKYQLDSLIAQSYKNIEIIIVDDCSIDKTRSILSDYQTRHFQIKLFFNLENLGFNKNFEKAIGLASGEFIALCDQDDVWGLDKLKELKDHIGDKGVIFSNSRLIDENGLFTGKFLFESFAFTNLDYRYILINNYVAGHTILAKTIFIKQLLPFPDYGYYDWWIGFFATYHHQITFLNKALTDYRIHSSSVIQKEVSSSNSPGISLIQYKACKFQLETFYRFLKKRGEDTFIKTIISLYSEKTSIVKRVFILFFLNYYYHILFPLHKRRKLISTTRFRIVRRYWNDVLECKHQVLGFI